MALFCPVAIPSCSSLIWGDSGVLLVVLSVVLCDASLSDSCTRVYVSLVHSGVQILRFAVAVAVPLGAAKQRLIFSLRVDYGSDPRGSAYRLPPARLLTSHATRAAGTRPSSACVEPLRRPLLQGRLTLLPVSYPVSTGGVTRRSAPGQLCGLALLTRWTCPHLEGRLPYSGQPRQLS